MKIVFIGTVAFSEKALELLIAMGSNVVGVCTKKQSSFNADYKDITPICEKNDIPYRYVDDINSSESIKWISMLTPDIIFCFGWSSIICKKLLQLPPKGIIGYHPAKLPENRGRHPIIWALALGLQKSASTFFFMQDGADDGDILSQIDFEIFDDDDASTVYDKVTENALEQIKIFVPQLENNTYSKVEQKHELSNTWRKRAIRDGLIDFRMSAEAIYNLIRALTRPYVGAHLEYLGKEIIIWKSEKVPYELNNIEPGKVLEVRDHKILVKTYGGAIRLLEHEFDVLPAKGDYL